MMAFPAWLNPESRGAKTGIKAHGPRRRRAWRGLDSGRDSDRVWLSGECPNRSELLFWTGFEGSRPAVCTLEYPANRERISRPGTAKDLRRRKRKRLRSLAKLGQS